MLAELALLRQYPEPLGSLSVNLEARTWLAACKDGWWTPQALRIRGKLILSSGADVNEAEQLLIGSIRRT